MMRLSDIVGRISPSSMYVIVALVLFFLVFAAVFVYAYILLGRDTVERFAAMPLEEEPVFAVATNQVDLPKLTPTEQAESAK